MLRNYVCAGSYISFCSRGRLTFLNTELSYFFFSFSVEVGLLNCINSNPVPRGTRNHPHDALWNSGLTSDDSALQLDLANRVKRQSQRRSSPTGFFSRAEDALKRRMT